MVDGHVHLLLSVKARSIEVILTPKDADRFCYKADPARNCCDHRFIGGLFIFSQVA